MDCTSSQPHFGTIVVPARGSAKYVGAPQTGLLGSEQLNARRAIEPCGLLDSQALGSLRLIRKLAFIELSGMDSVAKESEHEKRRLVRDQSILYIIIGSSCKEWRGNSRLFMPRHLAIVRVGGVGSILWKS